ncbi:MAG: hypothetical protein KA974_02860 [Saprospiraceae bacterium]|nr:hypothetical protein [Saprospiraceae bacterium]MBP7679397.1 hypothetical protein [Saprospiraceae bacterium]
MPFGDNQNEVLSGCYDCELSSTLKMLGAEIIGFSRIKVVASSGIRLGYTFRKPKKRRKSNINLKNPLSYPP